MKYDEKRPFLFVQQLQSPAAARSASQRHLTAMGQKSGTDPKLPVPSVLFFKRGQLSSASSSGSSASCPS
ncbi:MAG: hypothetical protein LUF68_07395, partial [Clostridiales bacterium]|nr:hypothetical protein [Clostridiales bacterium]